MSEADTVTMVCPECGANVVMLARRPRGSKTTCHCGKAEWIHQGGA